MKYLLVILFIVCQAHPIISKNIVSINRTTLLTIYFQYNTTDYRDSLSAQDYQAQHVIIKELMDANPEISFVIHGYQNSTEQANLSEKRAQKVKEELINVGVSKDRMIVKKEPSISIDKSTPDSERALTQKVNFTVMKQTE
jgi:hypothetical protein